MAREGDEQPRYMGISEFLERYLDRAHEVQQQRRRLTVESQLRDGACEFCDSKPIAWNHNYDRGVVVPRNSPIYWHTCEPCEQLYASGNDSALQDRILIHRPDAKRSSDAERLVHFRRADDGREPVVA